MFERGVRVLIFENVQVCIHRSMENIKSVFENINRVFSRMLERLRHRSMITLAGGYAIDRHDYVFSSLYSSVDFSSDFLAVQVSDASHILLT